MPKSTRISRREKRKADRTIIIGLAVLVVSVILFLFAYLVFPKTPPIDYSNSDRNIQILHNAARAKDATLCNSIKGGIKQIPTNEEIQKARANTPRGVIADYIVLFDLSETKAKMECYREAGKLGH